MQTVLVDIYNYCHRNKQLARHNLTPSTTSSEVTSTTSPMLRQASAESNDYSDCHIITEDVFHPEDVRQTVTPFSPVFTDQKKVSLKFPLKFQEDSTVTATPPSAISVDRSIQIPMQPETEKELISAISSSPPAIPKDSKSVHILNKPPANSSERRANRFSVTKILDSLGKNAVGVANKLVNVTNMDMKSKKQTPKDEVLKTVENPALPPTDNSVTTSLPTKSESTELTALSKDTETPQSEKEVPVNNVSVNYSSRTCADISLVSSPIEILDVVDPVYDAPYSRHPDGEFVDTTDTVSDDGGEPLLYYAPPPPQYSSQEVVGDSNGAEEEVGGDNQLSWDSSKFFSH
jgi:hypothetical protein